MPGHVCWVLGAGFSIPLGGPPLKGLLSRAMNEVIDAHYPAHPKLNTPAAVGVRKLYQEGANWSGGRRATVAVADEGLWSNAEQFIDLLDTAADGDKEGEKGAVTKRFERLIRSLAWAGNPPTLRDMGFAARRLVAAECCAFMRETSPEEERWEPYREWAAALTLSDKIVTFNYDLVLEKLGLVVVNPATGEGSATGTDAVKLHGSVNWLKRTDEDRVERFVVSPDDDERALSCADEEIAIATPGPSKRSVPQSLKPLWDRAASALKNASAIVFVGFRFPPPDAVARRVLLGAIAANNNVTHLNLHIVLGPDLGDRDVVRLRGLLVSSARRAGRIDLKSYWDERGHAPGGGDRTYQITTHPLWAEDFFTVWTRDELFAQRRWG